MKLVVEIVMVVELVEGRRKNSLDGSVKRKMTFCKY